MCVYIFQNMMFSKVTWHHLKSPSDLVPPFSPSAPVIACDNQKDGEKDCALFVTVQTKCDHKEKLDMRKEEQVETRYEMQICVWWQLFLDRINEHRIAAAVSFMATQIRACSFKPSCLNKLIKCFPIFTRQCYCHDTYTQNLFIYLFLFSWNLNSNLSRLTIHIILAKS